MQKDAVLNSLGLLYEDEKKMFESSVKQYTDEDKKIISEFNNLAALLPMMLNDTGKNISLSPDVKKDLMKKIELKNYKNNFEFIYGNSGDWFQHPVEGIKVKQLAVNHEKNYVMLLMKVAAGTQYPPHHHSGAEECYVIDGDLYAQGQLLGPGDFHHAEGGSDHEPLYTERGCTLLLVVDPEDYR